jgi:hypothetical protein
LWSVLMKLSCLAMKLQTNSQRRKTNHTYRNMQVATPMSMLISCFRFLQEIVSSKRSLHVPACSVEADTYAVRKALDRSPHLTHFRCICDIL